MQFRNGMQANFYPTFVKESQLNSMEDNRGKTDASGLQNQPLQTKGLPLFSWPCAATTSRASVANIIFVGCFENQSDIIKKPDTFHFIGRYEDKSSFSHVSNSFTCQKPCALMCHGTLSFRL
jgi:hypothetical protein